ncbi:transposase [Glutamicibacter sp. MNS18]|uniref:transposase n=1 Tax=Glutamicibacter sp. MNS18 TaxID=2989817 RepID=UPI00223574FC|nr:transposase [Glutamicibacter sp. MNS18]MCW4466904.1 transposase [Glutamicibacter sp. MNS18]
MPVDVRRLLPGVDATQVTAAQIREFIQRLMAAGEHPPGDPEFLFNMDACYDVARLALLLAELPVILIARVRSNRVFYAPGGARSGSSKGRPPRHGAKLSLKDPATHPAPTYASEHDLDRYVCVLVQAF